jgi:hypothetical protein
MSGNKKIKVSENAYAMAMTFAGATVLEPLGDVLDALAVAASYCLCTRSGTETERGERVEMFILRVRGLITASDEVYGPDNVGAQLDAILEAEGETKQ